LKNGPEGLRAASGSLIGYNNEIKYIFLNFGVQLMRILGTKNLLMSLLIINKKAIPPFCE